MQLGWRILKGWTISTETWEQPTSWWEIAWSVRLPTLGWPDSLKTMNTQPDKVIQSSALKTPPNSPLFSLHCFLYTCFFLYSVPLNFHSFDLFYFWWALCSFLTVVSYYTSAFHCIISQFECYFVCYRSKISNKVDCPRSSPLWKIYHQIRCVVIWHPVDWAHNKRQSAIPRYIQCVYFWWCISSGQKWWFSPILYWEQ